jgi:hypothetical protein
MSADVQVDASYAPNPGLDHAVSAGCLRAVEAKYIMHFPPRGSRKCVAPRRDQLAGPPPHQKWINPGHQFAVQASRPKPPRHSVETAPRSVAAPFSVGLPLSRASSTPRGSSIRTPRHDQTERPEVVNDTLGFHIAMTGEIERGRLARHFAHKATVRPTTRSSAHGRWDANQDLLATWRDWRRDPLQTARTSS